MTRLHPRAQTECTPSWSFVQQIKLAQLQALVSFGLSTAFTKTQLTLISDVIFFGFPGEKFGVGSERNQAESVSENFILKRRTKLVNDEVLAWSHRIHSFGSSMKTISFKIQ